MDTDMEFINSDQEFSESESVNDNMYSMSNNDDIGNNSMGNNSMSNNDNDMYSMSNNMYNDEYSIDRSGSDEFMNTEDSPTIVGGWYNRNNNSMFYGCFLSFIVVVMILFIYKMMSRRQNKYPCRRQLMQQYAPSRTGVVFDNTMVPTSYFDYNGRGKQYINWTTNN